jgi:hypothetical protein
MGYSHVHTHKNEKMEKSKSKKVLKSLQWSAVNGNVSLLTTGKFVATQFLLFRRNWQIVIEIPLLLHSYSQEKL